MRIRPQLLLAPVLLAGYVLLATPQDALAANGLKETGTTTYEVVPDKSQIKVTIQLSIYNGKPSQAEPGGVISYYGSTAHIGVEKQASAVSVGSNAGPVAQTEDSSDSSYRYLTLTYPNVYYGQTRVVTATYLIPAAPHAAGGFRAGKAYASLCAVGNGFDVGTVSVVVPDGYVVHNDAGGEMGPGDTSSGKQTYTSGSVATPYKFWTCIDAERESSLTHTAVTASGQAFDIQAWPEDPSWGARVGTDVAMDIPVLENLTGLKMPGGTVVILEAGDQQLGEYGGLYNSSTATAQIPETVQKDTVAHELSHIWFNHNLLLDKWLSEGLAGFSEQAVGEGSFKPCTEPGAYPDTGSPNLMVWQLLNNNSTIREQQITDYQYAASCYIFTTLAKDMGPDNLKLVLKAAYADQMAYVGTTADEKLPGASLPLSTPEMLDLIDERGMVPAGAHLDAAQTLLARYGISDSTTLRDRSRARAKYHGLATAARKWKLPTAIREPMSKWEFSAAETAMGTTKQVLDGRDSIGKLIPGLSLDGTAVQKQFESAATQTELDSLLALIKKEDEAAARLDQATKLSNGSRSILESIGLIGADLTAPLTQAQTDLTNVKPEAASRNAQKVIDSIDKSSDQGLLRVGAVAALLAIVLLLLVLVAFLRRQRLTVVVLGPGDGPTGPVLLIAPGGADAWSNTARWQQPTAPRATQVESSAADAGWDAATEPLGPTTAGPTTDAATVATANPGQEIPRR